MAKVIKYFVKFRLTVKELTKDEFAKLYDLMAPTMLPEEREALQRSVSPESKNDHVTVVFDPNNEEGYKNLILRILE